MHLDALADHYNNHKFIGLDPISIPHRFEEKQDIEIMGFLAATLAWGRRETIIKNCEKLIILFDWEPHQFITQHQESDLKRFEGFVHRTFNSTDLLYFIHALASHYRAMDSLEGAFLNGVTMKEKLTNFHDYFLAFDPPDRTRKHVASPAKNSTCKRLNMFLRWMVRRDTRGVDFGLWNRIDPHELMCPIDTHVARIARREGLLARKSNDWKAVEELTANLRKLDPHDPVKYDFALFGLGVEEKSPS